MNMTGGSNKKIMLVLTIVIALLSVALLSGCIGEEKKDSTEIVVISRESTSGTREFFWESVLDEEDFYGKAIEKTSNGEVHDTVANTPLAIGYVGLGYLDSAVKSIKVNGVAASVENVLSGDYPIARDLFMFTKGQASGLAKEFIDYLMSDKGQQIVEEKGFVPLQTTGSFNSTGLSGTLEISGSTTVLPIALKVAEEFMKDFPDVTINVNGGGSSTGISSVNAGTVDIGMASRDLKESEQNLGLVKHTIAGDGIAIIVHPSNDYIDNDDLTMAQLKSIYVGEIKDWTKV